MVYVTHDQIEAMTMGDRIVVMKDGIVHQVAQPTDLYDSPANTFVAGFIGTPPMNFFNVQITRDGEKLLLREETFALEIVPEWRQKLLPYVGKKVVFGMRPEHVGSPTAENIAGAPKMAATVEVVEPMGSESYLYLNTGQNSFIARVDSHRLCHVGDRIELALMLNKGHVFDGDTGNVIV